MQPVSKTEDSDTWLIFQEDRLIFIKQAGELKPLRLPALVSLKSYLHRQHLLGQIQDSRCFCAEVNKDVVLPDDMVTVPLRKAFELLDASWYRFAAKAFSIVNWDRNHQYCGRCGHTTIHKLGGFERVCTSCGLSFYPRISPSVIVLIKREDELLMARSPHFTPGIYGLIAGFIESGESIEEAIHREVREEVSIEIKALRYFMSQPWPFPDSLMIGFTAEYASGEIHIDGREIEAAGWYRYDNLPGRPSSNISIASKMIQQFIEEHSKRSLT
jgi:NAD+ diphosphatase